MEHSSRIAEDTGELTNRTSMEIGHMITREGSQYTPSPIIKHFFVSLFAVVHAAEYATIAWHRAHGAFIPKGAIAERCIMVMCPLRRSW